jgi:hypothetical protein
MLLRKIAFFGTFGHSRYVYAGSLHQIDGMPRSAGTGVDAVTEVYERTGNKGNMIHGEAPMRLLQVDRSGSCCVSVEALDHDSAWSAERIAEELSARFDVVVYSTANAVRPSVDPGCTAEVLDHLRCQFVVLGMGMQNPLPTKTAGLHPNLIALLEVCNRKSAVFGVRGIETETWLRNVGFDRAKALGCPSLFVYPKNVLGISPPDPAKVRAATTAGHLYGRVPRSTALVKLFEKFEAHYVMQEEIPILKAQGLLADDPDIYNDATGELRRATIVNVLEHVHRCKMPFASYRWFQDPNAWRAFASRFDFYLGDRLHGGVVALQTGVPALMMAEDRRVTEIADFFAIPRVSVRDTRGASLRDILAERLNAQSIAAMKEVYVQRFREFEATFKALDLPLTVSIGAAGAGRVAPPFVQPIFPQPTTWRRVKDWISDAIG